MSERTRVLILSHHYRPEPNFITADVAESLAPDFDVTVVVPHPNYPEGRFYPGTRPWLPQRRRENGVTIWRLPFYPYHGRSHLGRLASYLSAAFAAAVCAPLIAPRPHLVWVYHGPFTTALAALWFRLIGCRIVFTCADLWPESFLAAGVARPGPVMRAMFIYSRAINRIADLLICSTRGTLRRYAADGVPESACCYVPVWVDGVPSQAREQVAELVPEGPVKRIVYAGNLGPAQRLQTVILAAAQLHREGVPVVFDMYGTGASESELRELARSSRAENLTFHGRVAPDQAFAQAAAAYGQIVCLQPSPLFAATIPGKLSFTLAAASPILYGLPGESAAVLAESGGGIPFDPDDPATLAASVKQLLELPADTRQLMRHRLRSYYQQHFERSRLIARYRQIFEDLGPRRATKSSVTEEAL